MPPMNIVLQVYIDFIKIDFMKKLLFFLLSLLCILPACDNCDEDIPQKPFV